LIFIERVVVVIVLADPWITRGVRIIADIEDALPVKIHGIVFGIKHARHGEGYADDE
jgi:hypothetical protein